MTLDVVYGKTPLTQLTSPAIWSRSVVATVGRELPSLIEFLGVVSTMQVA